MKFPAERISCSVYFLAALFVLSGCTKHKIEFEFPPTLAFEKTLSDYASIIQFSDPQHGMMVSNTDKIYRTADGGHSWTMSLQVWGDDIIDLNYVSSDTAYAYVLSGSYIEIHRSTDAGQSWSIVYQTGSADGCSGHFINGTDGFFWSDGQSNVFRKTTDAGSTWTIVSQGNLELNKLYFLNSMLGFSRVQFHQLMRTQNGGVTWSFLLTNYQAIDYSVAGYSTYVFALGDNGVIRRSTDFGATWNVCFNDTLLYAEHIDSNESGLVVAYGHGAFLTSEDFGVTWTYRALEGSVQMEGYNFSCMEIIDNKTIVASGWGDNNTFVGIITLP